MTFINFQFKNLIKKTPKKIFLAGGVILLPAFFYLLNHFILQSYSQKVDADLSSLQNESLHQEDSIHMSSAKNTLNSPEELPDTGTPSSGSNSASSEKHEFQLDAKGITQLKLFDEIINTKNDNDPRMDQDLKVIDPPTRKAFIAKYESLPKEDRNARGTIIFLLGRNINSVQDLDFFKSVLSEKPCYSMENCEKESQMGDRESVHLESSLEASLHYPQLMALEFLKRTNHDPVLLEKALKIAQEAKNSPVPAISKKAAEVEAFLMKHKN